MPEDKLDSYRRKRDFAATSEPAGARDDGSPPPGELPRFVVQEHHATRLHWDLRLERDGVLVSWAVPNGIPQVREENRLAVHTEDHPLEYLDFHGEIPEGSYGAGSMTVWDTGTYETHKFDDAKVEVTFHGDRLRGRYGLFPTSRGAPPPNDPPAEGSHAPAGQNWLIHRMDPPTDPDRASMPEHVVPMLAKVGPIAAVPEPEDRWAFEVKWDGVRAIVYCKPGRLRIESRTQREVTDCYPEVRGVLEDLGMHEAVLDGEIVAFGADGRPSFGLLQKRINVTAPSVVRRLQKSTPVLLAIYDLLFLDGRSLTGLPWSERRERLEALELNGPAWRVPAVHLGAGARLLDATREQGLEGIIAKRLDSRYEPGRRSGAWLKIKHTRRQELVIAGWVPGEGRREDRIGAILTGYHTPEGLRFAGRVGTGFTERTLAELIGELRPLRRTDNPFAGAPAMPRGTVFADPELVAEIEFIEWTGEGVMRAPSFKGLRTDKAAAEVTLEGPPPPVVPGEDGPGPAPAPAAPGFAPRAGEPDRGPAPRAAEPDRGPGGARPEDLFDDVERLPGGELSVICDGRRLKLTNWDKVLFPQSGFTKGDLVAYYARVAPALLPHLHDRPLTLKRYPNGVESAYFYEKNSPSHRPDWVETEVVGDVRFTLAQDRATLVWLANLADIELHTSLACIADPQRPTLVAFDLDPGEGAGIVECCEVALVLRGLFERLGLQTRAKTSGSKGMQVYLPLNGQTDFMRTKAFARQIAELLEQRLPKLVVSKMSKQLRERRIFVDWSQNEDFKTTVTVYSVRARATPTVSTPLAWEEVEHCHQQRDPELLRFETDAVLARVAEHGDLFADITALQQRLPGAR